MGRKNNMNFNPLEYNYSNIFSYNELEFYAEDELVEILPRFSLPNKGLLRLLSGTYGPFCISKKIKVPFWVAILLQKDDKCTIIEPLWMDIKILYYLNITNNCLNFY